VTGNQLAALGILVLRGPLTVAQIAAAQDIPTSSAHSAVMMLSRRGHVHAAGVAPSGGLTFSATDAGRAALDADGY
jgi:DNA-binding IclR family transcriptional regulator